MFVTTNDLAYFVGASMTKKLFMVFFFKFFWHIRQLIQKTFSCGSLNRVHWVIGLMDHWINGSTDHLISAEMPRSKMSFQLSPPNLFLLSFEKLFFLENGKNER
jgi:hypothetical protein